MQQTGLLRFRGFLFNLRSRFFRFGSGCRSRHRGRFRHGHRFLRGISRFISPSGVASSVIREENIKLKQELFDVVGLAMQGRNSENHTAESKEWDFQHVKFFLADRADLLEEAEQKAWQLIHQFDRDIPVPEVVYNRNFAVRDLEKSISGLLQLSQLDSGKEFRRAIRNTAVEMLDELAALPTSLKDQLLCADPQPEKQ